MTHWARRYIGKPWAPDGNGPVRFSCWGLVREVFRAQHGVEFPLVAVGDHEPSQVNVAAIMKAARVSGMRPLLSSAAQDGDIVLMRGAIYLHCGVVVREAGRVKVLHSTHERGVTCDLWNEATAGMQVELWRRA